MLQELAQRRLAAAEGHAALLRQQLEAGIRTTSDLSGATQRLRAAALERDLVALEREELELGGRPPEDLFAVALTSPPVRGRDFASERLRCRREAHSGDLADLEAEAHRAEALAEAGVITAAELDARRAALESARLHLRAPDRHLARPIHEASSETA